MTPAESSDHGGGGNRKAGRIRDPSLTRTLPLQFALVLVAVMIALSTIAYVEVRRSAIEVNADRIQRVNQAFAHSAAANQADWRRLVGEAAAQPRMAEFLRGSDRDAPDLASLVDAELIADPINHLEMWAPDGTVVLPVDEPDLHPEDRAQARRFLEASFADSALTGPVYRIGHGIHFWVVAPVEGAGGARPAGYVALRRQMEVPMASPETLRDLLGQSVRVLITTHERADWMGLLMNIQVIAPKPTRQAGGFFTFQDSEGERWVGHEMEIEGTPWIVVTARPQAAVMAPVRSFVVRSGLAATLLLLLGLTAAGIVSRRLTRPIRRLSDAAEAIAEGDYGRRTEVNRTDEVGQLAATFNEMAAEVQKSHAALERQAIKANNLARALEKSNLNLRTARNEADRSRAEADAAAMMAVRARDEAEAASRAKSHFLATMSHEIRTPLNAIIGYADLLGEGISGPLSPEQRAHLERISRSSDHLKELVDDLLDLTRIEAGELDVRSVSADLGETLRSMVELARPEAESARIDLTLEPLQPGDASFHGDPRRVRQIVGNLLSNAIKFTPSGGRIAVAGGITGGGDEPRRVFMIVEDTGPGIADEDLERIFDPFVQLDSGYTRGRGGAGLGLPISRHLARLMGGDLTVRSEPGAGSRFACWLPEARADMGEPADAAARAGGGRRRADE